MHQPRSAARRLSPNSGSSDMQFCIGNTEEWGGEKGETGAGEGGKPHTPQLAPTIRPKRCGLDGFRGVTPRPPLRPPPRAVVTSRFFARFTERGTVYADVRRAGVAVGEGLRRPCAGQRAAGHDVRRTGGRMGKLQLACYCRRVCVCGASETRATLRALLSRSPISFSAAVAHVAHRLLSFLGSVCVLLT